MPLYDDANNAGKQVMDNALKSFSAVTKGFQQIAAETTDFTRQSYEQSTQAFERLTQVKSLDKAFEVQGDFAKSAYERWVAQATKMSEIYSDIAKEAYKPFENTLETAAQRGADAARNATA